MTLLILPAQARRSCRQPAAAATVQQNTAPRCVAAGNPAQEREWTDSFAMHVGCAPVLVELSIQLSAELREQTSREKITVAGTGCLLVPHALAAFSVDAAGSSRTDVTLVQESKQAAS